MGGLREFKMSGILCRLSADGEVEGTQSRVQHEMQPAQAQPGKFRRVEAKIEKGDRQPLCPLTSTQFAPCNKSRYVKLGITYRWKEDLPPCALCCVFGLT